MFKIINTPSNLLNIKNTKSKTCPTFCYPINKILKLNLLKKIKSILVYILFIDKVSVYCFRSVKFSVLSTFNVKPVLCYEVFKKWPLLSLFPGCIRKILPFFSLNNNFGTLNSCSGLFPFRHATLSYHVR